MGSSELVEQVRRTIEVHDLLQCGQTVVVGVSGGPDSLCLLHVLMRLRDDYDLRICVAHLNHCLRGSESDADADFVSRLARDWQLPATIESRDVAGWAKKHKLAIEEAARQVRYRFLATVAHKVGAGSVAVGHNADDQVETVLMHWLRGAGLSGMRGMRPASPLQELRLGAALREREQQRSGPTLIRPLLGTWRSDIEAYCAAQGLHPRFDRSNLDTTHYRNRLRHDLVPLLETYNPQVRDIVRRSATIMADDYALLREQAAAAWNEAVLGESRSAIALDLTRWRRLPVSLQRSLLREAIHRLRRSLRNINWVHVESALRVLHAARTGTTVTLPQGLEVTVNYERLIVSDRDYCEALPDLPWVDGELTVAVPGQTTLPESRWVMTAQPLDRHAVDNGQLNQTDKMQAFMDMQVTGTQLWLRPRRTGDRFRPLGMGNKTTSVASFMINAKIPRAWRARIPLLTSSSDVWWVAGWRIDERAKVTDDTTQVLALSFSNQRRG